MKSYMNNTMNRVANNEKKTTNGAYDDLTT